MGVDNVHRLPDIIRRQFVFTLAVDSIADNLQAIGDVLVGRVFRLLHGWLCQVKGVLFSLKSITDMCYQHILASHLYDRDMGHDVSNG